MTAFDNVWVNIKASLLGIVFLELYWRGKNRKELIIERLLDFNKVTIELIDPNKLLSPTMNKG